MNILVTGSTGFVGQRLCSSLLARGHEVSAAIRPSTDCGSLPKAISVVPVTSQLIPKAPLSQFDAVIHLAARAHILNDSSLDPEGEFFHTNTQGTINIASASLLAGVRHFIFISSIGAMATSSEQLLTEQTACNPDTPYGRSKLAAENALTSLLGESPVAWTILRPPLVYGPSNPGNMERLLKLVKRRIPLPLGAVHNSRSFIYIENLIDAISHMICHSGAINQTFLISDGEDISTSQLVRRLASYLNSSAPLLPIPYVLMKAAGQLAGQSDAISRLFGSLTVDSRKIRQTLNWTSPYTLDQGLQTTADWFNSVNP